MERICPFLAMSSDGRTVVDGYDSAHRCRAPGGPTTLDRSMQVGTCLTTEHRGCQWYVAAQQARHSGSWPSPAPDATLARTRLVLTPAPPRGLGTARSMVTSGPRLVIGGGLATVGLAAVAFGVAGTLSTVGGRPTGPAATPRASLTTGQATPVPIAATSTSQPPTPTAAATPAPIATATPTATPAPTPPPVSQAQTYVVQPGDTLFDIAVRFGTTVEALQQANGLSSPDVIRVGQVLTIP